MKKLILISALAAGSAAGAQTLQFNGGGSFTSGNLGFNFGVTAQSLANLNGVDVDVRLSGDISATAGNFVNTDILFNFPTETLNLYTGLGVSFGLSSLDSPSVFGTATLGFTVPLFNEFGVFAEGALRYNGNTLNRSTIRAGVTYTF